MRVKAKRGLVCASVSFLTVVFLPGLLAAQSFVPPSVPPEVHYVVDVTFDTTSHTMAGSGSATIRNVGPLALRVLRFHWFEWGSGSYELTVQGRTQGYPASAASVDIVLPKPLQPGATLPVTFRFTRKLGDIDTGFGIQRWFPQPWWGYETHASYDVGISAPADVIVGASARPDARTGRYHADHVRTFGLFFARGFLVQETNAGPTLVRSIFRPDMRACAELVLATAADAISYYRQRLGMYPQSSFTIIPGGSQPVGGYPYATAIVSVHGQQACAQKPRDSHWRWIAAHEVAHQYWLEQVLEKDPEQGYGWLMIGLGIWLDREYTHARGFAGAHARFLDGYADAVRKGLNTTIEIAPEELRKTQFDYNTNVTHAKGFGVISALDNAVGRATFDGIVQRALREYAGRRMGTAEFRRLAEAESGQDLGWFFVPLLRTNRFASYEITDTMKRAGSVGVRVVSNGAVKLPVPVEARFSNGERRRAVLHRALDEQTLEFSAPAALTEIVIDPDREFPLVNPQPEINATRLVELVAELPWNDAGSKPVRLYRRAVELDDKDPVVWRKLALTLFDGGQYQPALSAIERAIAATPPGPGTANWQFAALVWRGMLNDLLGHRPQALASYQAALALGGDPGMRHDQFGLVLNREFAQQRLQAPFSWH